MITDSEHKVVVLEEIAVMVSRYWLCEEEQAPWINLAWIDLYLTKVSNA